ncbi:MAG: copper amine oxidase [Ilumatobacteraceae bacterium]|nr:copper amine oxidase [Ilumatobacteraceae bacterium]
MTGRRRALGALVTATTCMASLAACGDDRPAAAAVVPHVFDLTHDPAANIAELDPDRSDVLPAGTLRSVLERDLAWHGITLVEMMRAARRNDAQLQAWIDAMAANTDDLVADVGLVYGPQPASAFDQQWAQHTQFLLDYAVAVRDGDDDAADLARSNLATYAADSGSFFETATGGRLPADEVQQLLQTHIGHMYDMITADADGNAGGTLDASLQDNDYLLAIANGLATAMADQQPDVFTGHVDTPTAAYCAIVTGSTGSYVLTTLLSDQPTAADTAATAFATATGQPATDVLGDVAPLSDPDQATVAATAKALLKKAFDYGSKSSPSRP